MYKTILLATLVALFVVPFVSGCTVSTEMTKEEEQQFGGRQPTAEELQDAMKGREKSSDPGK